MEDYKIVLGAILDSSAKGDVDEQLKAIKDLSVIVSKATLSDGAIAEIKKQLTQNGIDLKLVFSNTNQAINQAKQTGRQIGQVISDSAKDAIENVTSKVIGNGFKVSPKMSQNVQSELENIVKDMTDGKGKITSITIDTKTDFDKDTLENVEHLKSATVQYTDALGQVITKTLKWKQIGVTTFANGETEALNGWVEASATYKSSLENASKTTINFVNQQKKAVTDLTNQTKQIYSSAIDPSASKPIKDSKHLEALKTKYSEIMTAISNMGNASESAFSDERNSVNTLISDLKIIIREYKNAETAATSLRTKDVGTIKKIKTNELDEFVNKIKNSKVPFKEMKNEISSLKAALSNITDTKSLTNFLNQFDVAKSRFKSLKEEFKNAGSISNTIFKTDDLNKQGKIYFTKVRNSLDALMPDIESKFQNMGFSDIKVKGIEDATGKIKSFTVTVTDAEGAVKKLNFERNKIQGKGKAQAGFVQTGDVQIIKTATQAQAELAKATEKANSVAEEKAALKESKAIYDDLLSTAKELGNLQKEQAKLDPNVDTKQLEILNSQIDEATEKYQNLLDLFWSDAVNKENFSIEDMSKLTDEIDKASASIDRINAKKRDLLTSQVTNIQSLANGGIRNDYATQIAILEGQFTRLGLKGDEVKQKTQKVKEAFENLQSILSQPITENNYQQIIEANNLLQKELVESRNEYSRLNATAKMANDSTRLNNVKSMQQWADNNSKAMKKYGTRINEIIAQMGDLDTAMSKVESDKLVNEFKQIQNAARQAGDLGMTAVDKLRTAWEKFGGWSFATGAFMKMVNAGKQVYNASVELDDVVTDLTMATGANEEQINSLIDSYSELGDELKATITDVTISGTEWLKQGKTIAETETLIRNALVLSKVGDLTSADSTKYLTSAMKGYSVAAEDTLSIVDKLSAVDMASATDVGGLAEGMSEVAASAQLAGVSMDRLLGYLASVGEVTQEGMSSVGTAYNAIFARMGNIKLSRLTDYESGEDLSNVETVLKGVGISLRDSTDEFRDFDDVLDETASRWSSFSGVQQRAIANAFAG